ncbi:RNA polymerase sigma factor [Olivibacter domesticus]|uniref:RNA polymerase sigma-70 factor, ECF subfamily n=1 Tax=Olivibacter domesticus TaxID=407022 RepID=A0A1H7UV16_OLID1|nr:RNA polymerase sigma-70 factor [Olivibacter domesticus]SEM00840.1 RNA polymerase sigma-70 factor, ECF subfamily [Olivibacter domesticus]
MPPPLSVNPLLIAQLRNGSEQAFQSIYQQYHQAVYRFAYAFLKNDELSKEVTQEAFLSLWIHRQDLSETLPLYPYLFNKARRLTIDAFRRITSASRMQRELMTVQETLSNETEDTVLWKDLQQITADILKSLPKQQQMVFKLSRMEGLSYEEIAKELHISKNTVKYHLVCALKSIKSQLARYDVLYVAFIFYCSFVK